MTINDSESRPLFRTRSTLSANGTTSSAPEYKMTVPGLTAVTVPYFFRAGQTLTIIATAPPRLEPNTTSGKCRSNSAWTMRTASSKSSGRVGFGTSWLSSLRQVGLTPPGVQCQPWRKRILMGLVAELLALNKISCRVGLVANLPASQAPVEIFLDKLWACRMASVWSAIALSQPIEPMQQPGELKFPLVPKPQLLHHPLGRQIDRQRP